MIVIRRATLDDRSAVCALHAASIRQLCSESYSASQIERWAGFLTPQHYTEVITDPNRHFVVAEIAGKIVGFGQLHPSAAEIEAVYVHPEHAGAGVGGALLRHLEELAGPELRPSLHLTATLNAVPFYARHGFRVTGYGEHNHPSGAVLRCASMTRAMGGAAAGHGGRSSVGMESVLEELRRLGGSRMERGAKARKAADIIRAARAYHWVGLYDVKPTEIAAIAWTGNQAPAFPRLARTQGINGAAVAARAPVVVQDVTRDERYLTTFGATRSEAIFPVAAREGGDIIGTIDVESDRTDAFTADDESFLSGCAQALAKLWA